MVSCTCSVTLRLRVVCRCSAWAGSRISCFLQPTCFCTVVQVHGSNSHLYTGTEAQASWPGTHTVSHTVSGTHLVTHLVTVHGSHTVLHTSLTTVSHTSLQTVRWTFL